jgi:hypothetical protein
MLNGCDLIDEFLKDVERPLINGAVVGKSFPKNSTLAASLQAGATTCR